MLYIAVNNLMYTFLTYNYYLWRIMPDFLFNQVATEVVYTICVFPLTAFIFLSTYPEGRGERQIIHILKWVLIYAGVEWIGGMFGGIKYQYGWNLAWSTFFDVIMFSMLRLHYVKPALALAVSPLFAIFFIVVFEVPLNS